MKVIALLTVPVPRSGAGQTGARLSSGRSALLSSRRSLDHLGLPTAVPHLRAPPDPSDALAAHQPREWSYEPLFDDLPISDPVLA